MTRSTLSFFSRPRFVASAISNRDEDVPPAFGGGCLPSGNKGRDSAASERLPDLWGRRAVTAPPPMRRALPGQKENAFDF